MGAKWGAAFGLTLTVTVVIQAGAQQPGIQPTAVFQTELAPVLAEAKTVMQAKTCDLRDAQWAEHAVGVLMQRVSMMADRIWPSDQDATAEMYGEQNSAAMDAIAKAADAGSAVTPTICSSLAQPGAIPSVFSNAPKAKQDEFSARVTAIKLTTVAAVKAVRCGLRPRDWGEKFGRAVPLLVVNAVTEDFQPGEGGNAAGRQAMSQITDAITGLLAPTLSDCTALEGSPYLAAADAAIDRMGAAIGQ